MCVPLKEHTYVRARQHTGCRKGHVCITHPRAHKLAHTHTYTHRYRLPHEAFFNHTHTLTHICKHTYRTVWYVCLHICVSAQTHTHAGCRTRHFFTTLTRWLCLAKRVRPEVRCVCVRERERERRERERDFIKNDSPSSATK